MNCLERWAIESESLVREIKVSRLDLIPKYCGTRETLQELTPIDVFRKRLEAEEGMDEKSAEDLLQAFHEITNQVSLPLNGED